MASWLNLIGKENSMKLTKKVEHIDFPLYEPLEKLLTKLYHKVPNLTFESFTVGFVKEHKVIDEVVVFNGNEQVGAIGLEHTSFRNNGKCDVYSIQSPRIQNRIGSRHVKVTKLPDEALKTSVRVFAQGSTASEVITKIKQKMSSEIGGVQYNAVRQAERSGEDSILPLMELAMQVSRGETPTLNAELTKMVAKTNLEKLMNTSRIATSVNTDYKNANGIVVKEERDGTLLGVVINDACGLTDEKRLQKFGDTYEMPELYQTKLAMLRMLEPKQPVESIGIKFVIDNTNWYYLTGGEIITTS
jgi:hypothetical protein